MGPRDQILARMYVVLTLLSLLPVLVAGRVVWIYVADGEQLRKEGQEQYGSRIDLPAKRGMILDRAGRTLAVNTARYDLALDPTAPGFESSQSSFFEKLSMLTGQSAAALRRRVADRASRQYVVLVRGLTEPQMEKVASWGIPGTIAQALFARRYNYGTTAAHVLGHVGSDGTGLAGIELQYDDVLRGESGWRAARRDRRGVLEPVVGGPVVEPKDGQTLVLTIDLIRQTILEEELARGVAESGAQSGTAIAMDPNTGAILALANVPTYDPNRPAAFAEASWRDRAVTDQMEPGSTFKLVGAVAALERGKVHMEDLVDTGNGRAVFANRPMRDTHAHGVISFADVIALSSNIGMATVAERLDPGDLYQYARNMGFGQPTWVDLPGEIAGTLKKPSAWSATTLTRMSIGYEVAVTPLQLLTAYCALANGGLLVQPYVVQERRDLRENVTWSVDREGSRPDSIRRVFDRKTADLLRPAFEGAVTHGTATVARVDGLRVAGKTGTARKVTDGSYAGGGHRATFVGFFPADDPQIAMIVVMDDPSTQIYGGVVSAPVFQRIARRWIGSFPKLTARVAPTGALPESAPLPLPEVVGQPSAVASRRLRASGYPVAPTRSPQASVTALAPSAGSVTSGSPIRLETMETPAPADSTMPDLTGLSARDALFWLESRGVEVRLNGSGRVRNQSTSPGEALPNRVVLHCN